MCYLISVASRYCPFNSCYLSEHLIMLLIQSPSSHKTLHEDDTEAAKFCCWLELCFEPSELSSAHLDATERTAFGHRTARLGLYPGLLLPVDGTAAAMPSQPPADLIRIYTGLGRMNPVHILIISADMMSHFYPCQHHKSNRALKPQYPLPQAPSAQMCQQVSNLGAFIARDGAGEAAQLDSLANVCSAP